MPLAKAVMRTGTFLDRPALPVHGSLPARLGGPLPVVLACPAKRGCQCCRTGSGRRRHCHRLDVTPQALSARRPDQLEVQVVDDARTLAMPATLRLPVQPERKREY
jgi:hypothetical protein